MTTMVLMILVFTGGNIGSKDTYIGNIIAYPNPFNNRTENLTLAKTGPVDFAATDNVRYLVYNFSMQQVYEGSASGKVVWNGFDSNGQRLRPGLYYIRLIVTESDGSIASGFLKVLIK